MSDFDPSKGPVFRGQKRAPEGKEKLSGSERRGLGFVVGMLGGKVEDAAVLDYAVSDARTQAKRRRGLLSRFKR